MQNMEKEQGWLEKMLTDERRAEGQQREGMRVREGQFSQKWRKKKQDESTSFKYSLVPLFLDKHRLGVVEVPQWHTCKADGILLSRSMFFLLSLQKSLGQKWRALVQNRAAYCNRKLTALRLGFMGDYPYRWSLKLIVLWAVMLTANYR